MLPRVYLGTLHVALYQISVFRYVFSQRFTHMRINKCKMKKIGSSKSCSRFLLRPIVDPFLVHLRRTFRGFRYPIIITSTTDIDLYRVTFFRRSFWKYFLHLSIDINIRNFFHLIDSQNPHSPNCNIGWFNARRELLYSTFAISYNTIYLQTL